MGEIELRLTAVDPPDPEPTRTIYRDIVNLPDPVLLGMTIRYFNHDDVGLYMQITGSGAGYTFTPVNLGLLASGTDEYKNLDEFVSRAKPGAGDLTLGELEENITLILKGYTDAGYSILKWTFERVVTVHWINSADAAFTVDELDNFDDGTVQGWSGQRLYNSHTEDLTSFGVATDYVLSSSYSLKGRDADNVDNTHQMRFYKSLPTPNKGKVFAVIDLRCSKSGTNIRLKRVRILFGDALLITLGKAPDTVDSDYIAYDKWIRIVVPLTPNVTQTLDIYHDFRVWDGGVVNGYLWMDDFKIISK